MLKIRSTGARLTVLILSLAALPAAAQNTALTGNWVGSFDRNGRPVPVTVELKQADPGGNAGSVRFGEPYRCSNSLKALDAGSLAFTLGDSNGRFCDDLALGTLTLAKEADGRLALSVTQRNSRPGLSASLGPAADADSSSALVGIWTGRYQGRNGPVPLRLTIEAVRPGQAAGKISFAEPDSCQNELEFSGILAGGAHVFTPSISNGGRCDLHNFGTLTVTPGTAGAAAVMIDSKGNKRFEATLAK